jgi:hypothetical protein
MARGFRKLRMEQMEGRQMMAGDVFAYLQNGSLYVNEAQGQAGRDNGITISQMENGIVRIQGHDPLNTTTGTPSKVNGAAYVDLQLPSSDLGTGRNLYVNLGGSEDQIVFQNGTGGVPTFQNVSLSVGGVVKKGTSENDRIIVNSLAVHGSLTVDTGAGDDWVFLSSTTIGDGWGADLATINTGAGADTVTVKNGTQIHGLLDIQTYYALSETDADTVYFDTEAMGDGAILIRTGGGADNFMITNPSSSAVFFSGLTVYGNLTVDLGAGNDVAYVRGLKTTGNFQLLMGAGADNVTIDNRVIYQLDGQAFVPSIGGNVDVQMYSTITEADADVLNIYDGIIYGSVTARMGAGNDTFLLVDAEFIGNDLDLKMDAGNDSAEISGYVVDHLMTWMGEGEDILRLGKTWAYRLLMDGNLGTDRLYTTLETKAQYFDYLGWEYVNGRRSILDYAVPISGKLKTATMA